MTSKRQKNAGWLLPDDIQEIKDAQLVMFCGVVPNHPMVTSALRGAVYEVTRWWNWQKSYQDGDTRAAEVSEYMTELMECFMIDCCSFMRDCIGEMIAPLLTKQTEDVLKELQDLYDQQGTAGVAPDLVYDGTSQDLKRDILVCFMCRAFVNFVCDAEIQRRRENLQDAFWVVNIINQISILSLPILAPVAPWLAFAAAVGNAVLLLSQPLSELAEEIFWDTVARENVACCMYSALAGATPTYTAFSASLDGCGFSPLQNAEFIRNAIQPLMSNADVYLTWLATGEDIAPYVEQGLLDACPCGDWVFTMLFDEWDNNLILWEICDGSNCVEGGEWVLNEGWNTTPEVYAGNEGRDFLSLQLDFQQTIITSVELEFDISFGTWADTTRPALALALRNEGVGVGGFGANRDQMTSGTGQIYNWAGSTPADRVEFYIRASRDISAPYAFNGSARAYRLTFTGNGPIPFAGPPPPSTP